MVAWARRYGIRSTIHTGGPSIPGSGLIDKDVVLAADADVIGHINGGHTALPDDQIVLPVRGLPARHRDRPQRQSARGACSRSKPRRTSASSIASSSAPMGRPGPGVQPLGILRMIAMLASLGEVPAEVAFCFATGNTARVHGLDRGLIVDGLAADLVFLDRAQHTAGGERCSKASRSAIFRASAW